MTKIHVLPTTQLGPLQIQRYEDALAREIAAESELRSRVPHIRAIGSSLLELCDTLQEWADSLATEGGVPKDNPTQTACHRLIKETRCLAGLARSYPV